MFRYLQARIRRDEVSQALTILYEGKTYFPLFVHAAIDQDRPLGDSGTFGEHVHDLYHIVLYTRSSGYYRKCGREFRAEPGSLAIVSPGEPHDFVSRRRSSIYSEITFSLTTLTGKALTLPFERVLRVYTGIPGRLDESPRLPDDVRQELAISLIQIVDYLQSAAGMSDFYAQRALATVFDIIVAHCYSQSVPAGPLEHNVALDVKRYIDEHYAEAITIDTLAGLSHCSKGHLFRRFKAAFGISPIAYQQNLRFETAQKLLRFTPLLCYEVAHRVGYSNVYYFHRQFKKRTGTTPKQYRHLLH